MIDQDIKKFVLRALLTNNTEPLSARTLKLRIRGAFDAVFPEGELDNYLTQMADSNLVAMTKDEFEEILFGLTPKGKLAAERLIKLT
jgi:hypothetical protein